MITRGVLIGYGWNWQVGPPPGSELIDLCLTSGDPGVALNWPSEVLLAEWLENTRKST